MKKKIFSIAVVAAALTAGYCAYDAQENIGKSDTLLANVEALADGDAPYPEERRACIDKGGNWNMASVCVDSGFESSKCSVSGEITVCGVTIKGSFEKGKKYHTAWSRYQCKDSKGNCCTKQGLFTGETKLA